MDMMATKLEVLAALRDTSGLPADRGSRRGRSIYEIANPRGHFQITYASFPGGTAKEK